MLKMKQKKQSDKKNLLKHLAVDSFHLKKIRKSSKKAGLPPGALVHVGEKKIEKAVISVVDYNSERVIEKTIESLEACLPLKELPTVTWINIDGLHDIDLIEQVGKLFDIHPLILEDILNTGQRPKIEEHDNHLFIALKSLRYDVESDAIRENQVSIVTGRNYLISFQERPSTLFKPGVDRVHNSKLRIRKRSTDYLTYALLDSVVDHNFAILEILGDKLEMLDAVLMEDVSQENINAVFDLKKKVFSMRKSILPIREIAANLMKGEYDLIDESTLIYYRDVSDHVLQIIEDVEVYREVITSMIDTYLSTLSMKMNEVMKVLTIAAAIFMPLTFLAGIYGMNFKYMPELEMKWGYFTVWGLMIVLIIFMLVIFRRKKWL